MKNGNIIREVIMGVSIYSLDIPKRKLSKAEKDNDEYQKVFAYPDFFRGLLKHERTFRNYEEDRTIHQGLTMSYSGYNQLRAELAMAFLGKDINSIWERCSNLQPNQRYHCSLYYLFNFADNEGFIGPSAVKKMAKYLTPQRIQKFKIYCNNSKLRYDLYNYGMDLIDCILETAKHPNGYIIFS